MTWIPDEFELPGDDKLEVWAKLSTYSPTFIEQSELRDALILLLDEAPALDDLKGEVFILCARRAKDGLASANRKFGKVFLEVGAYLESGGSTQTAKQTWSNFIRECPSLFHRSLARNELDRL